MKSTKRMFILSLISLLFCLLVFAGSTYAWFTDTVTSANNKIIAGNLDVDFIMDKTQDGTYVSIAGEDAAIFSDSIEWEPGMTQIAFLGVKNNGNLALNYNVSIEVTDGGLVGALEYALIDGAKASDLSSVSNWTEVKALATVTADIAEGVIVAAENGCLNEIINGVTGETDYFAIAIHMKEEASNSYQGKNIVIDVNILATQCPAESDAFNNEYDKSEFVSITYETQFDTILSLEDSFEIINGPTNLEKGSDAEITIRKNKDTSDFGFYISPGDGFESISYSIGSKENVGDVEVGDTFTITIHKITKDLEITYGNSCFVAGTKITMADGSLKNIEDIVVGDSVKSFNHETGLYESNEVNLIFESDFVVKPVNLHFADGTDLGINTHAFFEQESNQYVLLTRYNYQEHIGNHFYNANTSEFTELVSVDIGSEEVQVYSIYVSYTFDAIANGMLSLPDDTLFDLNIYKFNSDLTADLDQLAEDINTYGLLEYREEFDITEEEFDMWNCKYVYIAFGKGLLSREQAYKLLGEYQASK